MRGNRSALCALIIALLTIVAGLTIKPAGATTWFKIDSDTELYGPPDPAAALWEFDTDAIPSTRCNVACNVQITVGAGADTSWPLHGGWQVPISANQIVIAISLKYSDPLNPGDYIVCSHAQVGNAAGVYSVSKTLAAAPGTSQCPAVVGTHHCDGVIIVATWQYQFHTFNNGVWAWHVINDGVINPLPWDPCG